MPKRNKDVLFYVIFFLIVLFCVRSCVFVQEREEEQRVLASLKYQAQFNQ